MKESGDVVGGQSESESSLCIRLCTGFIRLMTKFTGELCSGFLKAGNIGRLSFSGKVPKWFVSCFITGAMYGCLASGRCGSGITGDTSSLAISPSFNSPLQSLRRNSGVTLMLACDV